jgi:hypothetical protein
MEGIGRKRHTEGGLATTKSRATTNRSFAGGMRDMRKALVALPDEIWAIIDRYLGDTMGHGYSDTIRSIVLAWLSENGYLAKGEKATPKKSKDEEIDILDTMLTSLVDLLEEKGVITQEEWEQHIKKKLKA